MVKLAHRLEHAGLVAMRGIFERLSLDRGASIAAATMRPLSPALRKRATANLRLAMPGLEEAEYRRIVTGMTDHLTRVLIEYLHLAELRDTPDRIAVTGIEHLEDARARGRGALLVTGHLGNWEAIRAACARVDWTPALLYRAFNTVAVDEEGQRRMRALDAPVFHKGKRGTLGLLRHVRRGGVAMILCDQRFAGAPPVPFFGLPAKTSLAPVQIAQEYGAALLPARGIRRGRESAFDVTIGAPLAPGKGDDAAIETMTEINGLLESWIRETPEQYFWLHNRWGTEAEREKASHGQSPEKSAG